MFLLHSLMFPLCVSRRTKPLHLSFSSRSSCLISSHVLSFCDNIANIYSRLGLSLSFQHFAFSFMFQTIFRIMSLFNSLKYVHTLFSVMNYFILRCCIFVKCHVSFLWVIDLQLDSWVVLNMYFITYKVLYSRFPVFIIKKNISSLGSETDTVVA